MGLIYRVISPSNKSYIGQTSKSLSDRQKQHKYLFRRKRTPFYLALNKYGWDSFKWEILYENIPLEQLDLAEICAIYLYDSFGKNGYNCSEGGEGNKGLKHSEQTKIALSKLKTGTKNPKLSQCLKGRTLSQEHKNKISISLKGQVRGSYSREICYKQSLVQSKVFYEITTPEGQIIKQKNLREFCRQNYLSSAHMYKVAKNQEGRTQHKGYKCKIIF